APRTASAAAPRKARVELDGTLLIADGHPLFVRAIEYRGEPLKFLQQLGFNTLKVSTFPMPPLLAEAEQLGLWIICPPPPRPIPVSSADLPGWSNILCWDLGEQLSATQLPQVKQLAEEL